MSPTLRRPERPLHGRQRLVFGRESAGVLARDDLVADPDGELATRAFHDLGVDAGGIFECRCHTGSPGVVVSDLAVADANGRHRPHDTAARPGLLNFPGTRIAVLQARRENMATFVLPLAIFAAAAGLFRLIATKVNSLDG